MQYFEINQTSSFKVPIQGKNCWDNFWQSLSLRLYVTVHVSACFISFYAATLDFVLFKQNLFELFFDNAEIFIPH